MNRPVVILPWLRPVDRVRVDQMLLAHLTGDIDGMQAVYDDARVDPSGSSGLMFAAVEGLAVFISAYVPNWQQVLADRIVTGQAEVDNPAAD